MYITPSEPKDLGDYFVVREPYVLVSLNGGLYVLLQGSVMHEYAGTAKA